MWSLQAEGWGINEGEGSERIWRFGCQGSLNRRVGRKPDVEICLTGDKSVSREHAQFNFNQTLSLTDLGSAYGTFIAPASTAQTQLHKMEPRQETTLACGDLIRFGALHNLWRVSRVQLATCTSTCQINSNLLSLLKSMSVKVLPQWTSDCTHLTMSTITLTLKVLSALVSGKPIITASFWNACYESFQKDTSFPDPEKYLPPISEPTLNQQTANFRADPSRRRVFDNKLFIFVSRSQIIKYDCIIKAASGKTTMLKDAKLTKSQFCSSDNIVIQCIMDEFSQDSPSVLKTLQYLQGKNVRLIPEAEIGLAILFNSLQKYCNPKFNFGFEILKSLSDIQKSADTSVEIFAHETEQMSLSTYPTDSKKVDESIASPLTRSDRSNVTSTSTSMAESKNSRKTERSPTFQFEEPPKKKIVTESIMNTPSCSSTKNEKSRKQTDNNEKIFNFVNIENRREDSNLNIDSNVKSKLNNNKRKAHVLSVEEEDLFNFVSDAPCEPKPQTSNKLKRFSLEDSTTSEKKKICLENILKDNNFTKDAFPNIKFENSRWISSKRPSSVLIEPKLEVESNADQSIENQMMMLKLKPAVVVINNNLIKRENVTITGTLSPLNETKSNFKKFVKIQPLNKQTEVISRNKLSIYESGGKKISNELRSRFLDDEDDDNDQHNSLIDHQLKHMKLSSRKVRRL